MTDKIEFKNGHLTPLQIEAIFNALPGEVTFIDADDKITFYTQHDNPIFARKPEQIGIDVRECHKPESNPYIDKMIDAFRSGEKDSMTGWVKHKGMLILIKYIAARDDEGKYLGLFEYVQDILPHKKIRGQRLHAEFD